MPREKKSTVKAASEEAKTTPTSGRWWAVLFWVPVPEDGQLHFWMNVLLLHLVVAPVLREHLDQVSLYRFHCVHHQEKNKGHEWTFRFYANKKTASTIFRNIKANKIIARLKAKGVLGDVDYDDLRFRRYPEIKDRSDEKWHLFVQETWPYYAKGVSECWWGLVDRFVEAIKRELEGQIDLGDLEQLLQFYQMVHSNIANQWQNNGQHIFIHHLHAIIGWEPVENSSKLET